MVRRRSCGAESIAVKTVPGTHYPYYLGTNFRLNPNPISRNQQLKFVFQQPGKDVRCIQAHLSV